MLLLSVGLSLANDPRPAESAGAGEMRSWRTAARHSAGLAPDPVRLADTAIVQVYAAATFGWRGYFAVHPWIIYKRAGDTAYTRHDVIGWGRGTVVRRNYALPDGFFTDGGMTSILKTKLFWAIGPQFIGMFLGIEMASREPEAPLLQGPWFDSPHHCPASTILSCQRQLS